MGDLAAQRVRSGPWPLAGGRAAAAHHAIREMADGHICERLPHGGLTPREIARAIGVSRTTLYRAFEQAGGVHAHVMSRRLERSFAALAGRRGRSPSICQIAIQHGFVSDAHFTRAFKARFGIRPSDVGPMEAELKGTGGERQPATQSVRFRGG
jgi:AraC-like DNA-binding protein